jgi:hypothetical protein
MTAAAMPPRRRATTVWPRATSWPLRLRALLSKAHGDATAYANFRDRHRDMAKMLGFEGHIAWAMP